MSLGTILLIVVILMLLGVLPHLAARSKLGLRSQWNPRCRIGDRNRPVVDGAPVTPRGDGGMYHYKETA
jgi:hypothetical protein